MAARWRVGVVVVAISVATACRTAADDVARFADDIGRSRGEVNRALDDAARLTGRSSDDVLRVYRSADLDQARTLRDRIVAVADDVRARYGAFKQTPSGDFVVAVTCDAFDTLKETGQLTYDDLAEAVVSEVRDRQAGIDSDVLRSVVEGIGKVIAARASERFTTATDVLFDQLVLGCPL